MRRRTRRAAAPPVVMSVNVHIGGRTPVRVHAASGSRVWLEIGRPDGSLGVFLDRDGLAVLIGAVVEAGDLLPPPVEG